MQDEGNHNDIHEPSWKSNHRARPGCTGQLRGLLGTSLEEGFVQAWPRTGHADPPVESATTTAPAVSRSCVKLTLQFDSPNIRARSAAAP